ncbi:hypothetical protein FNSP10_08610 [Fusobacterium nucleatum]|nr:hypothetical protein FNCP10_23280 [Fusobacterium nucleatum]BEP07487.1 hypothetical protein FNSP10_08610 [Fusobacterium nucleatum]
MTVLEENEKLNTEIKKIIESLNFENKKIKRKKFFKILKIIFIVLIVISGILLKNNMEVIKNKIFKTENNEVVKTTLEEDSSENFVSNKIENVVTDISDNQKLFRTTLGDNYAYVASNSNENVIEKEIEVDLDNNGKKEKISFGDNGDGIYFDYYNPTKDKLQFLLSNDLLQNPKEVNYYFDNGWIRKDVSYQITVLDLDNDGIKEIIFSAYDPIDSGVASHSFIWKVINEEYRYIGNIPGQTYMYFDIDRQSIIVPIGTQGLYKEYKLENQKIKEVSMNNKSLALEDIVYETYYNQLFGFSFEYPIKIFEITSEYNDRFNLETPDSEAFITCTYIGNLSTKTLENIYEEKINSINTEISYKKLKENDFVISYEKNGYIKYIKVVFNPNKKTFMDLEFKYTSRYKDIMNSIIERMTKSVNTEE